jgi:glycosyltransferase involved in cell wall biosynthesis
VPRVTVTIITKNEAAHIGAAIDSASWADEIIVVDSDSSDDTVALAAAKGVRVESRTWTGWVDQKNFAASLASSDWIFSLDADERVTPALSQEIKGLLRDDPPHVAYKVPRVTFHLGRWIRTTDFYPDYQTRLYDRRAARWSGLYVHESVTAVGSVGRLTQELQHYSYRDLGDHLDRINAYSTLAARQMYERGRRASALDLFVQAPAAFLRNYILRRGVLDGAAGLLLSMVNAHSVFLKFAKLWELQRSVEARQRDTADHTPVRSTGQSHRPGEATSGNTEAEPR